MFSFFLITIYPENGPWTKESLTLEETMKAYDGLESNKDNANDCSITKNYLYTLSSIFSLKKKKCYYNCKKQEPYSITEKKQYIYCNGEIFEILKE